MGGLFLYPGSFLPSCHFLQLTLQRDRILSAPDRLEGTEEVICIVESNPGTFKHICRVSSSCFKLPVMINEETVVVVEVLVGGGGVIKPEVLFVSADLLQHMCRLNHLEVV